MLNDELRENFLTGGLSDGQRAELLMAGDEVRFEAGDVLFAEGAPADYLWILLDGELELTRRSGTETIVVGTLSTPGQWAGGLRAWEAGEGTAGYRATSRAKRAGRFLRIPSEALGRLVSEWFPFGKHMIVGIYQTVRGIEATVRQRESLVALGTLAAGLAHEINNPAAASLRAVDTLDEACETLVSSLGRLVALGVTADAFAALDALRAEAANSQPASDDALAVADREEAIGLWLADRGLDRAWHLAAVLASSGVDHTWCERVFHTVGDRAFEPALDWATSALNVTALLGEVRDSTTRVSQLVAAVKSYSQMDRASLQRIDIHEGLDSTLVMLSHKLEDVVVERSYGEVPQIEAHPGELNQVWTNLIDNALDAMDGSGSLRIVTSCDESHLVVELSDTGHGMTPDVMARAFEPFFTTKDVGKGTGLGLDISRRIIDERHHGEISFDSGPTGTTARVRIPLRRASGDEAASR